MQQRPAVARTEVGVGEQQQAADEEDVANHAREPRPETVQERSEEEGGAHVPEAARAEDGGVANVGRAAPLELLPRQRLRAEGLENAL